MAAGVDETRRLALDRRPDAECLEPLRRLAPLPGRVHDDIGRDDLALAAIARSPRGTHDFEPTDAKDSFARVGSEPLDPGGMHELHVRETPDVPPENVLESRPAPPEMEEIVVPGKRTERFEFLCGQDERRDHEPRLQQFGEQLRMLVPQQRAQSRQEQACDAKPGTPGRAQFSNASSGAITGGSASRSTTITSRPLRFRASAVASPPMPPPMTAIRSASPLAWIQTRPRSLSQRLARAPAKSRSDFKLEVTLHGEPSEMAGKARTTTVVPEFLLGIRGARSPVRMDAFPLVSVRSFRRGRHLRPSTRRRPRRPAP